MVPLVEKVTMGNGPENLPSSIWKELMKVQSQIQNILLHIKHRAYYNVFRFGTYHFTMHLACGTVTN